MPRNDDRSYAQAMRDHEAEKKFLRKIRHRAFHPDADSPVIFQLAGYFVRLVIILAILGAILFVRNRKYFSGESFSENLQAEFDHYLGGEESKMGPRLLESRPSTHELFGHRWTPRILSLDRSATGSRPSDLARPPPEQRVETRRCANWRSASRSEGRSVPN